MRLFRLTTIICCAFLTTLSSAQTSNEAIVQQFYPEQLIAASQRVRDEGGPELSRSSIFVTADLDRTGREDYLVALYSNGIVGGIRVLKKQNGSAIVVDEPASLRIVGTPGSVNLLDLDNDGRTEIEAVFLSAKLHETSWPFRWTGTKLELIGPTETDEDGKVVTELADTNFVDVDGDGILEALPSAGDSEESEVTYYRLSGGKYAPAGILNYFEIFVRATGAPEPQEREFDIAHSDRLYNLKVINGQGGKDRVSSAEIRLNGSVVVTPERFSQQVSEIIVPVSLLSSNKLTAELRSAPGSRLIVVIEPRN